MKGALINRAPFFMFKLGVEGAGKLAWLGLRWLNAALHLIL